MIVEWVTDWDTSSKKTEMKEHSSATEEVGVSSETIVVVVVDVDVDVHNSQDENDEVVEHCYR
jgi:hypothetical protein